MVHRPADSRLLTNLLTHEKEYSKHLGALLDGSHASLASFSAYASASSPPTSQIILAVTGYLAGADDALRRYGASVEECREHLKGLKNLEDEVGNIMRDREILVTRLIKASKSEKPNRDSLVLTQPFPSSSTLSLRSDFSNPLNTSAKLSAAQSELQACEAHLAAKERELLVRRTAAIQQGLTVRSQAMVECGRIWSDLGRESMKALETLSTHPNSNLHRSHSRVSHIRADSNDNKPLPDHAPPSSELSSIAPSQSASQINLMPTDNGNYLDYSCMQIPPAHAISDNGLPTSSSTPHSNTVMNGNANPNRGGSPIKHVLSRRITEENLALEGGSSDEEEQGDVQVVENPRFGAPGTTNFIGDPVNVESGIGKRFTLRKTTTRSDESAHSGSPVVDGSRGRKPSGGHKFFGSLRGLFKPHKEADGGDSGGSALSGSKKYGKGAGGWDMRTESNLKALKRRGEDESDDDDPVKSPKMAPLQITAPLPAPKASLRSSPRLPTSLPVGPSFPDPGPKRVGSDVGAATAGGGGGGAGRRLKKERKKARSSSVPPVSKESKELTSGVSPSLMRPTEDVHGVKRAEEWVGGQDHFIRQEKEREAQIVALEKGKAKKKSKEEEGADKGWASDGNVTSGSAGGGGGAGPGVKRRTSTKGKGGQLTTITVPDDKAVTGVVSGSGANLSRNSSLTSAASAPAALNAKPKGGKAGAGRRVSLGPMASHPPLPESTVVIHRRGASIDSIPTPPAGGGTPKAKAKSERRVGVPVHGNIGEGNTSLMSIVEDVARGNKDASDKMKGVGGPPLPLGMLEVKAPPAVGRAALLDLGMPRADDTRGRTGGGGGADLAVPRAPGSVFDAAPSSTIVPINLAAPTPSAPAPGPEARETHRSGGRKPASRPAVSPLRSALRNASRTPSPLPPPPTAPPPVTLPKASPPPPLDAPGSGDPGSGESDDDASISSYETGHENFDTDEGEETEQGEKEAVSLLLLPPPPPPPPREPLSPLAAARQAPREPPSPPAAAAAAALPAPKQNGSAQENHNGSYSSPAASGHESSSSTAAPARRKSVRVSLKPTFSPTPPAIEDDDGEAQHVWGNGNGNGSGNGNGNGNASRANGAAEGVPDMWEDSSEEDVAYQKAKRLLTRAAKKEKKNW